LIWDHRSFGSSDGIPRQQFNPHQIAEDYHDAISYAASLPGIDPQRVVIWGIGHSAGASIISAADDPVMKAAILVMPWLSGRRDQSNFPDGLLERAWEERRQRCKQHDLPVRYIKPWDDTINEARASVRNDILLHGELPYEFNKGAVELSRAAGTPWTNEMTLQSLHFIARKLLKGGNLCTRELQS
jgi:uncharacterized protein